MPEYLLDQYLGDYVGEASRADVLASLRGHILSTVIVSLELPEGSVLFHTKGSLLAGSRDPEADWAAEENPEVFGIDDDVCEPVRRDAERRRGPSRPP